MIAMAKDKPFLEIPLRIGASPGPTDAPVLSAAVMKRNHDTVAPRIEHRANSNLTGQRRRASNGKRWRLPSLQAARRGVARFVVIGICVTMLATDGEIRAAAVETSAGICRSNNSQMVGELDRVYRRGEFRIIYTMHGAHALASAVDRNGNGIPDQVDDIATQLVVARRIYSNIIGLTRPLDMPRYADAQSIDVFLSDMKRGNGLAYDEVVNYRLVFDGREGRCTLRIDLNSNLTNQNLTPAHELFHLYQYGYSMFKAPWFLEGTARWAELALGAGAGPQQPLPETAEAIQAQLLTQAYRAGGVWNNLAQTADPDGRMLLPSDLAGAAYLDGSAVVQDDRFHGAAFMKTLLEELNTQSARVSSRRGWDRYNWNETDQKSSEYNKEIFQAVMQVLSRHVVGKPSRTRDLKAFLDAGSEMTAADP